MLEKFFNVKKRFFERELKQTEARIWGHEFSQYTTLYQREKTRQMYDNVVQSLQQLEARPEKDTETISNLEKQRDLLKQSLDDLAVMIEGAEPSEQYPEGVRGIRQSLEDSVQKREHIKNFIKHYC